MTNRDLFFQVERIFREACDLPKDERDELIRDRCFGNEQLESEVRAMLDADASPLAGALDTSADATRAASALPQDHAPGQIGAFSIVRRLGAGGMGVVYEARQDSPRRTVALKVVRASVLSPTHRRRFELEAQLLARLQHPGIATIYETGSADTGAGPEPYFAMELIDGVTLTDYVREKKASQRQTLALFAEVCDAVHHAHQKGVIHRDLKPGNILVTAEGRPKILDFGVARLAEPDGESMVMHTTEGQLVGTLAYMSPEQVGGDPAALDTRSDIYSLGVILYELLAGRLPYDFSDLSLPSAIRVIGEGGAPRLGAVSSACRGDVETVVSKALETDRERRYDSAAALAMDIRRYLADEPIAARPASTAYQLRKFARRNKALVTSVGAIVIVLAASSVFMSILALREAEARVDAVAALERSEEDNANYAAVLTFLQDMLRRANPAETGGDQLTLREALDRAAERIDDEGASTPAVDAAIRETIGETYVWIGRPEEGVELLESSLAIRTALGGEMSPEATRARRKLARTLSAHDKDDRALALLDEIEPALRQAADAGEPVSEEFARVILARGIALKNLDRYDEAERVTREAIDLFKAAGLETDGATGDALNTLGSILLRRSDYAGAEPVFLRALELYISEWGADHARTATIYNNLSLATRYLHRMDDAESYARKAYEVWLRIAGGQPHDGLLSPEYNLGVLLARRGKNDEAIRVLESAVEHHEEIYHGQNPRQAFAIDQLARVYAEVGRHDDAADLLNQARDILVVAMGERHAYVAVNLTSIARLRTIQGRHADAARLNREALDIYIEARGPEHPWTATGQLNLAESLVELGEHEEAEELLLASINITETVEGDDSPNLVRPLMILAESMLGRSPLESEAALRRSLVIEESTGSDPQQLAALRSAWAGALAELGRYDEAEKIMLACHSVFLDAVPPDALNAKKNALRLARLFEATGDAERASEWTSVAAGQ